MKVRDVITIKDALELMRREQVHRLPVVSPDGVLQGILSINDVVLHSEEGKNRENVQTFSTLVEQMEGSYTLLAPSEENPPAFDEKGYSPLERVFNEQEE
jgi:CBS domain-containing protein